EAKTQRDLLESYLVKYREASARDSISAAPPEARIISRAAPAVKPAYPKKLAVVLIAAFAALALSAGLCVSGAVLAAPGSSYAYTQAFGSPLAMPATVAPPLAPAANYGGGRSPAPGGSAVDQVAHDLQQTGESGRCVAVAGTLQNVATSHTAIMLARAL